MIDRDGVRTRDEAQLRVSNARVGSLAATPSREYLYELRTQIHAWLKAVENAIRVSR